MTFEHREPGSRSRPDHPTTRWLAPAMVAVVVVTVFGVIAAVGWNHRHAVSTSESSAALGWWTGFPIEKSPRPLVLTGPDIIDPAGGFPSGDSKLAYVSGSFQLKVALPAGPVTVGSQQVMSAAEALAQLRGTPDAKFAPKAPLAIIAVRLDTAAFSTDRGVRPLPAWSFRFAGVVEPAFVLAIPSADRWPRPGMPTNHGVEIGATISSDGTKAVVAFTGAAAGTGPCEAEYAADISQGRTAVMVSVRQLANNANQNAECDAAGHYRTVTVTLQPPLGNRVLIDPRGAPLPDVPLRPAAGSR